MAKLSTKQPSMTKEALQLWDNRLQKNQRAVQLASRAGLFTVNQQTGVIEFSIPSRKKTTSPIIEKHLSKIKKKPKAK